MKKHRIVLCAILLVLTLGSVTRHFAQDAPIPPARAAQERQMVGIALLRTINTGELGYKQKYGSYATWQVLSLDEANYFEEFLSMHGLVQSNPQLGNTTEILPGWNLRLNVHTDRQGYDVLLEDQTGKDYGYAALSDERAIIRECKWLK